MSLGQKRRYFIVPIPVLKEAYTIIARSAMHFGAHSLDLSSFFFSVPENNHFLSKEFMGVDTSICLPVV